MSAFKVGDVCEIIGAEKAFHLIGMECTVTNPNWYGRVIDHDGTIRMKRGVEVRLSSKDPLSIPRMHEYLATLCPHHLKKKTPPAKTTTWDEVMSLTGWSPKERSLA